jgi:hypothetical protein
MIVKLIEKQDMRTFIHTRAHAHAAPDKKVKKTIAEKKRKLVEGQNKIHTEEIQNKKKASRETVLAVAFRGT